MQTARQFKPSPSAHRKGMIAAIQITWPQLRPDLRHAPEELREERLAFIQQTLGLKRPVASLTELSDRQIASVLDAMRALQLKPHPASSPAIAPLTQEAEIIHLASAEQTHTINKLCAYLGWNDEARRGFLKRRYRRDSPAMLSPKQAHGLIRILFNIAASRDLKQRGATHASQEMIREEIPHLKARLGIDRKRQDDAEQE